jgi:GH25 family lysozyme M1 (1,4-beta-N-acetylmuramidase)
MSKYLEGGMPVTVIQKERTLRLCGLIITLILTAALILAGARGAKGAVTIKTQAAADSVPGGIRGIDVSKWQGNINWESVAKDDVSFVLARATLGIEVDETFYRNATGAHAAGIKVGAYHYAKFTDYASMMKEAELFIKQLDQVTLTYPAVLDVEAARGLTKSALATLCSQFLEEVRSSGYDVMLYTYDNFIDPYLNMSLLGDYKIWVANYLAEPNRGQSVWQYSSYGSISGITGRVDLNVAYEDISVGGAGDDVLLYVDADVSRSIKETLNQRYNAGLPLDSLNMEDMSRAISVGLQLEVNSQFGISLPIYDQVGDDALYQLASINYVPGQTSGNITWLTQVRLFYMGHYTGYPTGSYDDATVEAIRLYQSQNGLEASGLLNQATVWALMGM